MNHGGVWWAPLEVTAPCASEWVLLSSTECKLRWGALESEEQQGPEGGAYALCERQQRVAGVSMAGAVLDRTR